MNPKDAVYWYAGEKPSVIRLGAPASVDAVVVGGGAAGLMAALVLHRAGKNVIVLEADVCGGGATGKSSGFITPDSELEYSDLVSQFCSVHANTLWDFGVGGLESMRSNILSLGLVCDYQEQDSLFVAKSKKDVVLVQEEYKAQKDAGFSVELYDAKALPSVLGSQAYYAGVRTTRTFGINGFAYCQQLKQKLQQMGVLVYERSRVTALVSDGVQCERFKVTAGITIVCTDRFLPELGLAKTAVYHVQTFLGLTEPLAASDAERMFPSGPLMVWDTSLIYQYFRLTGDNRLLIGSADLALSYWPREIHSSARMTHKLERYLRRYFPNISFNVAYLWPGLIGISKDFAPIAGQAKQYPNTYFAGAGAGLPWATALGEYIVHKALEGRNELDVFFSPERKYPLPDELQRVTSKPVGFALNHGLAKYKKYF